MRALGKGSLASIVKVGLSVLSVLLWLGLGATVLAALLGGALALGLNVGWVENLSIDGDISITDGGVTVTGEGPGLMSWPIIAIAFCAALVGLGGALIIVDRLRRLFVNFTTDEPFNRANADHLRAIWITMMVVELSKYLIAGAILFLIVQFGKPEGVDLDINPSIDLSTWASILILIVLAEVFREGARLREEQDLTI